MKAIKPQPTYNTLSRCLEPYFGDEHPAAAMPRAEYCEPEQGLRTVLFKSRPLQLDHMRRRESAWKRLFRAA